MQPWPLLRRTYLVQNVSRQGTSSIRENKTITVGPVGVLRVELHEFVEENVGHWGHAHRGTGMAGVGLGGTINLGNGDVSQNFNVCIQAINIGIRVSRGNSEYRSEIWFKVSWPPGEFRELSSSVVGKLDPFPQPQAPQTSGNSTEKRERSRQEG